MSNILHDASVAIWAWRTRHPDYKDFRLAITPPISIRRLIPRLDPTWTVILRRPCIHLLNAYQTELDYLRTHASIDLID